MPPTLRLRQNLQPRVSTPAGPKTGTLQIDPPTIRLNVFEIGDVVSLRVLWCLRLEDVPMNFGEVDGQLGGESCC